MEKEKLKEIVENTISGEWGTEEKKDKNDIFVIRTADFLNDGRINYNNVIKRNIAKRKIEEKSLKIGDIIVEKSGGTDKNPVGRVVLFERENYKFLANNFTQVLRIKKEYYYKFIFYQLLYKYKNGSTLQMFNKTTGIQNLQMKLYLNQELNVCDKKDQIKISNLLDKIQEIIDFRKKQIEEFDELIKSQFVEMFGDPNYNDKNWTVGIINDIGLCVAGATPSTAVEEYWKDGNIPWLSSGEVNKGRIFETDTKITKKGYDSASTKLVPPKTVLLAMAGQGKTRGLSAITEIELCTNQSVCSIVNNERVNPEYLLYFLRMQYNELRKASTSAEGRGGLNLKIIGNYRIMIPPIELQNKFAEFVEQIDKQKFEIQKSLEEIQLLQESLMNKYFGEI